MYQIATKRTCLECSDTIQGRSDKKFCNDSCRNAFNNRANNYSNESIRRINYALRRNRKILEELYAKGKTTIQGSRLRKYGYNFNYLTNYYRTHAGELCVFCYELGLIKKEDDCFNILKEE